MSQSIKPRNFALAVVLVICAILALIVLFAPKPKVGKPALVAQITTSIQTLPLSIPAPIQIIEVLIVYKIQKRDTLTKIARVTCNTVDAIAKRNNIQNPDKIYAGKSLTLVKVGTCSPESVKSKTFPEKFTNRTNDGASQGKSFTQPEIGASRTTKQESAQKDVPIKTETPISAVSKEDCKNAASPLLNIATQTMAIAECIKRNYGTLIKEGIAAIDERVSPLEVVARMIVESKGDPFALNKESSCKGLMQLQPGTAKQYGVNLKKIYDPRENIFGSIRVMSDYTYRLSGGNIDRGRVAYNAGPNSDVFRQKNFNPTHFKYTRQVRDVLSVLEAHKFFL
jgi:LysM repeat protein